jgi:hypothetical protein
MEFEVLLQAKQPNFYFFPLINLSIEGGWFGFLEIFRVMTLGRFSLLYFPLGMRTSFATRGFLGVVSFLAGGFFRRVTLGSMLGLL